MILFLIVIEIIGLILLGKIFGLLLSVIWISITFFLGFYIFKSIATTEIAKIMQGLAIREDDVKYYMTLAAIGLMLPGLISDVVGFGLLFYASYLKLTTKKPPKPNNGKREKVIDITEYQERTDKK